MKDRDITDALVGIVGDFNAERPTHRATSQALSHAGLRSEWVPTPHPLLAGFADAVGAAAAGLLERKRRE